MFLKAASPTPATTILKSLKDALSNTPVVGVIVVLVPFRMLSNEFPIELTRDNAGDVMAEAHRRAIDEQKPVVMFYGYSHASPVVPPDIMSMSSLVIDIRKNRWQ